MTFYGPREWWNDRYKIRRQISLTPDSLIPGSESLCAIKLDKAPLSRKIKPDYSDLFVILQPAGEEPEQIPFYALEEDGNVLSIIFDAKFPILEASDDYFVYYCGQSESRTLDEVDVLDPADLTLKDAGQNSEFLEPTLEQPFINFTKWTFQKPTVLWVENTASKLGSQALFEFTGHKADFYFQTGPGYGKFEYQIDDGEKIIIDCFNSQNSEDKLVTIDTNELGTFKVRFFVLGEKNPASSSPKVEIAHVDYHQILIGEHADEEFLSSLSNSFTIGS